LRIGLSGIGLLACGGLQTAKIIDEHRRTERWAAGPSKLGQPHHHTKNTAAQPTLAPARETKRMAHARLAWLVGHCFALRLLFRFVLASLVWNLHRPRLCVTRLGLAPCCAKQFARAGRSSLLVVASCIAQCSVFFGRAAQSPAISRCQQLLAGADCSRQGRQRRDAAAAAEE
jgi:hypothetical protein